MLLELILAILILAGIGVGIYFWIKHKNDKDNNDKKKESAKLAELRSVYDGFPSEDYVKELKKLAPNVPDKDLEALAARLQKLVLDKENLKHLADVLKDKQNVDVEMLLKNSPFASSVLTFLARYPSKGQVVQCLLNNKYSDWLKFCGDEKEKDKEFVGCQGAMNCHACCSAIPDATKSDIVMCKQHCPSSDCFAYCGNTKNSMQCHQCCETNCSIVHDETIWACNKKCSDKFPGQGTGSCTLDCTGEFAGDRNKCQRCCRDKCPVGFGDNRADETLCDAACSSPMLARY